MIGGFVGWYLRDEIKGIWSLVWLIWCWVQAMYWRLRFGLQTVFGQTAAGVLLAGSFYVLLELFVTLVRFLRAEGHVDKADSEGVVARTLALLPAVEAPPIWVEAMLLALAVLVFLHHWHEWKLRRREAATPSALAGLIDKCKPLLHSGASSTDSDKQKLFETTMEAITTLLRIGRTGRWFRKDQDICISITALDHADTTKLAVICVFPTTTPLIDKNAKLSTTQSAAGKSYEKKVPIYVPSTRHLGGINMKTYRTVGLIFEDVAATDPGPSLMCVPVLKDSNVTAVINVSSSKRNAFGPLDFGIVSIAAAVLADERWHNEPPPKPA
ncbi:MAG: hypothetical protein ACRD1S_11115 [Vicinamibacterales bacterium]